MATRGAIGGSQGHVVRGLMGGAYEKEKTGTSWSNREQQGKGLRETGEVPVDGGPQGSGGMMEDMGIDGGKRRGAGLSRFRRYIPICNGS